MNLQDAFSEISKQLGSDIQPFPMDGELKRFKGPKNKYPFWAIGREWDYKGNSYIVIKYGDWRNGSVFTWKNYGLKGQSKSFVKKEREAWEEIIEKEKTAAKEKHESCVKKWKPLFKAAKKSTEVHEYLASKDVESNHLAKINSHGTLLIPAYNENGFVGCQMIFKSEETQEFVKYYTTGIEKKGSFHPIGKIKGAKYIYVAEGFATAASIYEITKVPCVVAWDCNNLYPAIETIRKFNPKCRIIIACDKDVKEKSKDISVKKALFCKSRFSNIIIRVPKFENFDSNNTDFNDLMQIEGSEKVKEQLEFSDADFIEILLLGHDDSKYYYFNSQSLELKAISVNEHNKLNLLSMADNRYWGNKYRFKVDKDGLETSFADFEYCVEKLFAEQRQVGFFNYQNVRGYGAWLDGNKTVINLGDRQIVDGEFRDIESKYLYTSKFPLPIDWENPLTDSECGKIIELFKLLNYKNPSDYIYLSGFVALAQIFNAIDWRFQLWITGARGSGKTEIMKIMSKLIFDGEIYQSVTAASIRQFLKTDAIPMLIDEAEPNSIETKKRMDGVIELIRQCSSRMNTKMLRGTAHGTVQEFNINSIFCLASIQTYLPTSADVSRFFVVDMNTNEHSSMNSWLEIQKLSKEIEGYAPRLFARMIRLIPDIRKNIDLIKNVLVESGVVSDPRQADQISTAMASYFALIRNGELLKVDEPMILETIAEMNLGHSDYESDNKVDESENCLNVILDLAIDRGNSNVNAAIQNIKLDEESSTDHQHLEFLGLKYIAKKDELFVPLNNVQLKKSLSDTMYQDHSKILRRSEKYKKDGTCRINNRVVRGIFISI